MVKNNPFYLSYGDDFLSGDEVTRFLVDIGDSPIQMNQLRKSLADVGGSLDTLTNIITEFDALTKKNTSTLVGYTTTGKEFSIELEKIGSRFEILNATAQSSPAILEKVDEAFQKLSNSTKDEIAEIFKLGDAIRREIAEENAHTDALEKKIITTNRLLAIERIRNSYLSDFKNSYGSASSDNKIQELQEEKLADIIRRQTAKNIEQKKLEQIAAVTRWEKETQAMLAFQAKLEAETKNTSRTVKEENDKAVTAINISWGNLARFFTTHLIYTSFYKLIGAMRESIDEARNFDIAIAEIQTISQESQLSTEQWTESLRKLSDQFARPLADVAEAQYQTLSNQIAKGAESVDFLTKSLEFSRVTQASAADSVNLLSSALNGYQLKVTDTYETSAKFFKIIELGRVRASELANTFGRTAAISNGLGVSFEEVGAGLTVLTRQGIRYNEAYTLINNVLLKLAKPTEGIKKAFKELGVESGEAAIATFGFLGTLQQLQAKANGSNAELTEMFRDIRAVRGAFGFLGEGAKQFSKDLEAIKDSATSYANAIQIVNETPAFKVSQDFEKIKNIFTIDFGERVIEVLAALRQFNSEGLAGELKELFNIIKIGIETFVIYKGTLLATSLIEKQLFINTNALAVAQLYGSASTGKFAEALTVLRISTQSLNTAFKSFAPILIIAGLIEAYNYILDTGNRIEEETKKLTDTFKAEADKQTTEAKNRLDRQLQNFKDNETKKIQVLLESNRKQVLVLEKLADDISDKFDELKEKTKIDIEVETKLSQKTISDIEKAISELNKIIKDDAKNLLDTKIDLAKEIFNFNVEEALPLDKIKLLQDRLKILSDLQNDFIEQTSSAGTPDALNALRENYKKDSEEKLNILKDLEKKKASLIKEKAEKQKQLDIAQTHDEQNQDLQKAKEELANITELNRKKKANSEELAAAQKKVKDIEAANKNENSDARIAQLKDEISSIDAQLDSLKSLKDIQVEMNGYLEQDVKFRTESSNQAQKLLEIEQKKLTQAQRNAKEATDIFTIISKQKITDRKGDLLTPDVFGKQNKEFDEAVKRLQGIGVSDPKLLLDLLKEHQTLIDEYNTKINAEEVKKNQEKIHTIQKQEDDAQKKRIESEKTTIDKRVDYVKKLQETLARLQGNENSRFGQLGFNQSNLTNAISAAQNAVQNPTIQNTNRVHDLSLLVIKDLEDQFKKDFGEPTPFNLGGVKVGNSTLDKIIDTLRGTPKELKGLDNTKELNDLNKQIQDYKTQIETLSREQNKQVSIITEFNGQMQKTSDILKNFSQYFNNPNFTNIQPFTGITPTSAIANNTSFGNINITVNGGSTDQQTIENIGKGLEKAIRNGTFSLNPSFG